MPARGLNPRKEVWRAEAARMALEPNRAPEASQRAYWTERGEAGKECIAAGAERCARVDLTRSIADSSIKRHPEYSNIKQDVGVCQAFNMA
jgi:hypothetical protein